MGLPWQPAQGLQVTVTTTEKRNDICFHVSDAGFKDGRHGEDVSMLVLAFSFSSVQ